MHRFYYSFLALVMAAASLTLVSCGDDDEEVKPSGTPAILEAVDLGLPSRTLWANCNIGATSPEQYGDYFAWGETTGYNSGKTTFTWENYKWCKGDANSLTKYCGQSEWGYNGKTDGLIELETADDAASANWGGKWRTPSLDQLEELVDTRYTTCKWTNVNGVRGVEITSLQTGKSIFLPASGHRSNATTLEGGLKCEYNSRMLNSAASIASYCLHIKTDGVISSAMERASGTPIRPVCEK